MATDSKSKTKKPKAVKSLEATAAEGTPVVVELEKMSSKSELKTFLISIRDRLEDESVTPIYAMSAINYVLTMPAVYDLLDVENKELARDIWLRVKQAGFQLRNPPLLFGAEGIDAKIS